MRPAHDLLTFYGDLVDGTNVLEQWSVGLRAVASLDHTPLTRETFAWNAFTAFQTHMIPVLSNQVGLRGCKVSSLNSFGRVGTNADGTYDLYDFKGAVNGAVTGGAQHPLQTAVAIGLTTLRSGPTGKGRIFLPTPRVSLEADGRLPQATADGFGNAVKGLINAINGSTSGGSIVVASTKGYTSLVNGVRVGRVVDTMRSRRRDQVEAYTTYPLS